MEWGKRLLALLAFGASFALAPLAYGQSSGSFPAGGSSGTVTSVATGCGASGGTITTTGTIIAAETVSSQTGANYAITNANCGQLVLLSNGSAQTPTIAQAGSGGNFASGWYADVYNAGAGTQTITPATSTINGAASYALVQNQGVRIVSDGTNYQVALPGSTNAAGLTSGALPAARLPALTGDVTTSAGSAATTLAAGSASNLNSGTLAAARVGQIDLTVTGNGGVKQKYNATTSPPAAANDNTQGYNPGSLWFRTDLGQYWINRDATTNTAKWDQLATIVHPGYVASQWYGVPLGQGTGAAGSAMVAGSFYCVPIYIQHRVTVGALGFRVTTLSAGANAQLGLFNNLSTTTGYRPGTQIDHTANISVASAVSVSGALGANQQVEPGIYWVCLQSPDATVRIAAWPNAVQNFFSYQVGSATLNNIVGGSPVLGVSTTGSAGTWADFTTGTTWTELVAVLAPIVAFQVATVP